MTGKLRYMAFLPLRTEDETFILKRMIRSSMYFCGRISAKRRRSYSVGKLYLVNTFIAAL